MKKIIYKLLCAGLAVTVAFCLGFLVNYNQTVVVNGFTADISQPLRENDDQSSLSNDLQVTFFNVGMGDCIFVKLGDTEMLIDSGEKAGNQDVFTGVDKLVDVIKNQCADKVLEYLIVTHGDSDHLGIMHEVLEKFSTGKDLAKYSISKLVDFDREDVEDLYTSGTYINYKSKRQLLINQKENGIKEYSPISSFWEKDVFKNVSLNFGNAVLHLLYNEYYFLEKPLEKHKNSTSVCLMLEYGKSKVLLTGDLEEIDSGNNPTKFQGETKLAERYKDSLFKGGVTLFKANHHGSDTSNSSYFLSVIKPKYVAIPAIANSEDSSVQGYWGFPRQSVLDNFLDVGSNVYITAEYNGATGTVGHYHGDITFTLDKFENVIVDCSNKDEENKKELYSNGKLQPIYKTKWFKENRTYGLKVTTFSGYQSKDNAYLGNCTIVEYLNYDILLNCGNYGMVGKGAINTTYFADKAKENCLDGVFECVIVSSPMVYCLSQMENIFNECEVENLIDFGNSFDPSEGGDKSIYKNYVKKRGSLNLVEGNSYFKAKKAQGVKINIVENLSLTILKNDYYEAQDDGSKYESGVCILLQYFDKQLVFMGDLSEKGEKSIADNNDFKNVVYYQTSDFCDQDSNTANILSDVKNGQGSVYVVVNAIAGENPSKVFGKEMLNRATCDRLINFSRNTYVTMQYFNNAYQQICGDITFTIYENEDLTMDINGSHNKVKLSESEYYKSMS